MTNPANTPKVYHCEDIKGYNDLEELALDLLWSWNRSSDVVWQHLDADLWEQTHNPWVVLQTVSREKLEKLLSEGNFCKTVNDLLQFRRLQNNTPAWFQNKYPKCPLSCVAYFSMEFMLSEGLPIYSGGLGNVAGDQLKSASDLGIPVIAIGLLYQQGYFRQMIDKDGAQLALYPYNDPGQLAIKPLRKADGEWLRIEIHLPGWSVWLRTWEVKVGRVKLYLLDSNDAANLPVHRGITSELYGGGNELRLQQEIILGVGGWRLLEAMGLKPEVCHLNEGHAAFAVLERAKSFMKESGLSFEAALAATRAGNLFTTHTAVPAGFDLFSPFLMEQYLGSYAKDQLGISLNDLLALGRSNPSNTSEDFNMAYLAIRGSGAVNGVSRLHGKVSQNIFTSLFPRWPVNDVPICYVTNGVHMPSWDSEPSDKLWTECCGKDRWLEETETLEKDFQKAPDVKLWQMRNDARKHLVEIARKKTAYGLSARGAPAEDVERAKKMFDPNTLTIGFARRFATYKRPNLLLHDPERLLRILTNPQRPVQLVIAGKAHPKDLQGQAMIKEWFQFINRPEVRPHVAFAVDYDMLITETLVGGVDLWINTPRRPWEACGTSGMKVLVNGGLNLSELDGWWVEAYTPEVGWALGDGREHGDDPAWDTAEANTLYDLLEKEVIPEFYSRNKEGIPENWLKRVRQSMAHLTPRFSANRAVREYTEKHYIPLATAYKERAADKGAKGAQIVNWQNTLKQNWQVLRFAEVKVETVGDKHQFEVQVYLNNLDPNSVKVELYSAEVGDHDPIIQVMTRVRELSGSPKTFVYQASVPSAKPASDYTPRIIPVFTGASVPLEANQILWQR